MNNLSNKIKKVKLKDIKPYKNNVKVHTPEQIQQIKKSIEDNGYIQKICISRNNTVVIGHGRLEALKLINPDMEIEVIDLSELPAEKIKKLRILDNSLNQSEWNLDKFELELKDIYGDMESDIDDIVEDLSFDKDFINDIISRDKELIDNNPNQKEIDENIKTEFECPKCKYKWS